MKYRRATIAPDDWQGEFGSYDEWARFGPQPPYRTATFFDARGRRCITQHDFARARDDRAFPLVSLGKDRATKAPLGTGRFAPSR